MEVDKAANMERCEPSFAEAYHWSTRAARVQAPARKIKCRKIGNILSYRSLIVAETKCQRALPLSFTLSRRNAKHSGCAKQRHSNHEVTLAAFEVTIVVQRHPSKPGGLLDGASSALSHPAHLSSPIAQGRRCCCNPVCASCLWQ